MRRYNAVMSLAQFKAACVAAKPVYVPAEGSHAFMFWRAVKGLHDDSLSSKEIVDARVRWEAALASIGGDSAVVDVNLAVESFNWHCGQFNQAGKQGDGSSALETHRNKAEMQRGAGFAM